MRMRAHLYRQVKVIANPPLQILHILAHPLHGLVRAVHAPLQLRLLFGQLLLDCTLVRHLKSYVEVLFTFPSID